MLFQKVNDINKIISLQNCKSYIRQDIDLSYQELYFYDEFRWVMDQKEMEVHKAYLLTKRAILHDQELYFLSSWKNVSSNNQKQYFLRKVIYNVKSNKISFMKSYKLTEIEVDRKPPSSTEMRKYVK